jgi:hypothetical protein
MNVELGRVQAVSHHLPSTVELGPAQAVTTYQSMNVELGRVQAVFLTSVNLAFSFRETDEP